MHRTSAWTLCFLGFVAITCLSGPAWAVKSSELYRSTADGFGRFEARVRFAPGDGVVSSFFLWKDGSEQAGTFWNELDFEKLGADCHVETNAIYGNPSTNHSQHLALAADPCGGYHTYAYEWTPDSIAWLVDGVELRRETGATAAAFAENAAGGMQIHFNVWPGDASFGGNFSPSILPVHEYVDWVQYSSYADGVFTLAWREDFAGTALPAGWSTGNWGSPKNLSTHDAGNVNLIDGYAVLSLTSDDAVGPAGAMPGEAGGSAGAGGVGSGSNAGAAGSGSAGEMSTAGAGGTAGATGAAGTTGTAGAQDPGGTAGVTGSAGTTSTAGATSSGGTANSGGATNAGASNGNAGSAALGGSAGSADLAGPAQSGEASEPSEGSGCHLSPSRGRHPRPDIAALCVAAVAALRRARRLRPRSKN